MSQNSAIEWTESTWNPVRGCTKVSPGCANCYAETFAERWRGVPGHAYEQGFDLRLVPGKLDEPLRRKKPTTYFVNSMSDLFQDGVPDAFIDRVFAVMALAPQHTFQILTKRADRMRAYLSAHDVGIRWLGNLYTHFGSRREVDDLAYQERDAVTWTSEGLDNVWLGVSVENQHFADERIPLLLQTPAAVRFISAEPLLGPVDLRNLSSDYYTEFDALTGQREWPSVVHGATNTDSGPRLDWVIVGCESGIGRRNQDDYAEHARSLLMQCGSAGVALFVKQMPILGRVSHDPADWPGHFRIREMPAVTR